MKSKIRIANKFDDKLQIDCFRDLAPFYRVIKLHINRPQIKLVFSPFDRSIIFELATLPASFLLFLYKKTSVIFISSLSKLIPVKGRGKFLILFSTYLRH